MRCNSEALGSYLDELWKKVKENVPSGNFVKLQLAIISYSNNYIVIIVIEFRTE